MKKWLNTFATLAVLCACSIIQAVSSVAIDSTLHKMDYIRIKVGTIDADGKACGLTKEAIETAAELPIRTHTKLKFHDSFLIPSTLSIVTTSVRTPPGWCATSVDFRLYHLVLVKLPYQDSEDALPVLLYNESILFIYPMGNPSNVVRSVEQESKRFALAWQKQNPN